MKKNLFPTIILILIVLGSCFKTDKIVVDDGFDEKDPVVTPLPTIDSIIINGIPEDTTKFPNGISYQNDSFCVIKSVINPGEAISTILENYNLYINSYKLDQA